MDTTGTSGRARTHTHVPDGDAPEAAPGEPAQGAPRAEPSPVEVRRTLTSMLRRAGLLDAAQIVRCERVLDKLGDEATLAQVLERTAGIDRDALLDCIRRGQPDLRLGSILVQLGMVDAAQLRRALQLQAESGRRTRLGELLVARRVLRETDLTRALASQLGYRSEEPEIGDCDPLLLERLSPKAVERQAFLPVRREGDQAVVAFVDPLDQNARTEAARVVEAAILPVMCSPTTMRRACAALARRRDGIKSGREGGRDEGSPVSLVERLLAAAVDAGASDVHIEPLRDRVRVRVRVDGILRELSEFATAELPAVVSRLKIMAEADIAERRRHQDGRLEFEHPDTGAITDLRASFYVTVHGECTVLRVLNQANRVIELERVGMAPTVLARFRSEALETPSGVVVVTGPTGSGKTSTLYSCVHHLADEATSIITAEDPVEYQLDGISQCSVAPKLGRTFEESLRHIVRQDPDVIVLGEIRDASSAESAIQAALTGHKVLTTFHTEDSVGAVLRLLNMDIESFLIASTVSCVVAQRLVRRVCAACAAPAVPDAAELAGVGWREGDVDGARFVEGVGCASCQFTGYRGRIAVFEALVLNEAVREAILERGTATRIRRVSLESSGLVTLLEDGLAKASRGETTLAEIRRTLPRLVRPRPLQEIRRLSGLRAAARAAPPPARPPTQEHRPEP